MPDVPKGGGGQTPGQRRRGRRPEEAEAILVARTRLGLTQPAFAARLSEVLGRRVDRTQVAKWEAGVYRPRAAVMLAAAALVSMPLHQLLAEGAAIRRPSRERPRKESAAPELAQPRQQVLALLDLGFSLPEAIDLVRRHSGTPEPASHG